MSTRASIGARMSGELAPGPMPTGQVERGSDGADLLVFRRRLPASPERVWELVTDPQWSEQWLGSWTGDPHGSGVDFAPSLQGEPGLFDAHYDVERLERPHLIEVVLSSGGKRWRHVVTLHRTQDGQTDLTLVESVPDRAFAPLVGSGADYHLDRLAAFLEGRDPWALSFDDYVAGQAAYYRKILPVQRRTDGDVP